MDKYYEMQSKNKEQSIKNPDKPKLGECIDMLETMAKHWGVKKLFFKYH